MVIRGYVGGDDEALLIAALKECIEQECADAWDKVETKYMYIGSVIETAIGLGYIKKSGMTFAGYVNKHVGYGEKTARDCLRSWEKRHDFAEVKAWVLHGNTGYKPPKATGPLLYLDAHKAWSNRLKPNRPPPTPKLTLKDARTMLMVYRDILDSVGAEHLQLAQYADREPRAWLAGAQRRMEIEARFSKSTGSPAAPYHAKRPDKLDEEVVEDVIETGTRTRHRHAGAGTHHAATRTHHAGTRTRHAGTGRSTSGTVSRYGIGRDAAQSIDACSGWRHGSGDRL